MKLPPYADVLQARLAWDAGGAPLIVMPFHEGVLGRPGFLQGGAIGGLLEVAAIAALRHALAQERADARIAPVTVTVDYMRGGRDHETYAAGTITRLGSRVANVEATAWQADRARPIAAARMNYLIGRD